MRPADACQMPHSMMATDNAVRATSTDIGCLNMSTAPSVASASQTSAWYQRRLNSSTKIAPIAIQNATGVPELMTWTGACKRRSSAPKPGAESTT